MFLKAGDFMKTIRRKRYLEQMIALKDTPDIKIITGVRRSGKSQLMQSYIEYLQNHFDHVNIIFIDYMDLAFEEIKEYKKEVLIVHGAKDKIVNISYSERAFDVYKSSAPNRNVRFEIIKNGKHGFSGKSDKMAKEILKDFMSS